jgi:hypothetical protein
MMLCTGRGDGGVFEGMMLTTGRSCREGVVGVLVSSYNMPTSTVERMLQGLMQLFQCSLIITGSHELSTVVEMFPVFILTHE